MARQIILEKNYITQKLKLPFLFSWSLERGHPSKAQSLAKLQPLLIGDLKVWSWFLSPNLFFFWFLCISVFFLAEFWVFFSRFFLDLLDKMITRVSVDELKGFGRLVLIVLLFTDLWKIWSFDPVNERIGGLVSCLNLSVFGWSLI